MTTDIQANIRRECLQPAIYWSEPTGAEIQGVIRLAGFTGRATADYLGLVDKSGRTIRRWASGESPIPYSAWALLCHAAGFGAIWELAE